MICKDGYMSYLQCEQRSLGDWLHDGGRAVVFRVLGHVVMLFWAFGSSNYNAFLTVSWLLAAV